MTKYRYIIALILLIQSVAALGQSQKAIFVENRGQWPDEVQFRASLPSGFLFLKKDRLQFSFYDGDAVRQRHQFDSLYSKRKFEKIKAFSYEVILDGMQVPSEIIKEGGTDTPMQYFLGEKRISHVQAYEQITVKDVYPHIDLRIFRPNDHGKVLKYEFVIHKGGDVDRIRLRYQGAKPQHNDNTLSIPTPFGTVQEGTPVSYQANSSQKHLRTLYKLKDQVLRFKVPEKYNHEEDLIIDPELIFSTFSGSFSDNWGNTATYDDTGHLYSGGVVFGAGFPTTVGAFDVDFGGVIDMGIIKYSPDGTKAEYITFIGGVDVETPHSMIVDDSGHLVILGTTSSYNFPTSSDAFQKTFGGGNMFFPFSGVIYNGSDMVICKLSNDGTQLLNSTYLGGNDNDGAETFPYGEIDNYGDAFRGEVITDEHDYIYVASSTYSSDFPLKNTHSSTVQTQDAVLVKLKPNLSDIVFSTMIGGSSHDFARSLKRDKEGNIFIAGATLSQDFPTQSSAMIPAYKGTYEKGFVAKFDKEGKYLTSTYVGEGEACQVFFLDLDPDDQVFVLGSVIGKYPVSSQVYNIPNSGQFIHKISNDLSTSMLSTVFGSGSGYPDISPTAFLVNECGNIYLAGWGGEVNTFTSHNPFSTTFDLPVTDDAYIKGTDGSDFYVMELDKDCKRLTYATFIGGGDADHVDGGTSRFSKDGTIYHATCACGGASDSFPTTPNAWSTTNNSSNCNNAAFKFNTEKLSGDFLIIDRETNQEITQGCVTLNTILKYNGKGAKTATWIIEDSTIYQSVVKDLPYTFTKEGKYKITLKVVNIASCTKEVEVTKYLTVHQPIFNISSDSTICHGQSIQLKASGVGKSTFAWHPNVAIDDSTSATPTVTPLQTTTYQVDITDKNGCKSTEEVTIKVLPKLMADFEFVLRKDCGQAQYLSLKDKSHHADTLFWYIDGEYIGSQKEITRFDFEEDRPYEVKLICKNRICEDSTTKTIEAPYLIPFAISPDTTICEGQSVQLTAQGSLQYHWQPSESLDYDDIPQPTATPSKTTTYHVTLNDISGCEADSMVVVDVIPKTDFKIDYTLNEACGELTSVTFNNTTKADSFFWDLGDGTTSDQRHPKDHVYQAGEYDVVVVAQVGKCSYTYQFRITILDTAKPIANVITPNGDGKNDTFELIGTNYTVEIHNRWGKSIFQSDHYQNDWGYNVTSGVYYYTVTSNTGKVCKGWIEVIK